MGTLKVMKENYPAKTAEYAKSGELDSKAAFQVRKTTVKYGIKVPRNVEEAKLFNRENGNTFWQDAIDLEMHTILPAFDVHKGSKPLPRYSKSSVHIVFDLKMMFQHKAWWVKDGHLSPDPINSNYAGVVSRESVRIAYTYAALNGLEVAAADSKSVYLQAPTSEKHNIICGEEFPYEMQGKIALTKCALYGGKSAGSDYWKHMHTCMEHLGFTSCKADTDVWMRPGVKPEDETEYWEFVLLYVDDTLCLSHCPKHVLEKEIGKCWFMKKHSIGEPSIYLGNKVSRVLLENGVVAWSFSSSQYPSSN
eukprot:1201034-Ditylum_brightwellii.AAC.2